MVRKHAEIVGAGFGGLITAIALAERGWSVRIHERRPTLQGGEGYGIAIHRNMACIFTAFDVLDPILRGGKKIDRRDSLDRNGQIVLSQKTARSTYRVDRQHVISVLAERAAQAGVEIVFGAMVTGATPEGTIELADGRSLPADLVVGADGVNSATRDSVGLLRRRIWDRDGGVRVTIPRSAAEKAADANGVPLTEAWSDRRRIIACPVTDDHLYLLLTCTTQDAAARETPIDPNEWAKSFPSLRGVLERAQYDADWAQARWVQFQTIHLKRWSAGRVAIVGDAAHAMSPYLAQGAGHAMMNGLALAVAVADAPNIRKALRRWEKRERPLTDHTQRWTRIYGATMLLPEKMKQLVIRAEKRVPWIGRQYVRAANHVPTGTLALTAEF